MEFGAAAHMGRSALVDSEDTDSNMFWQKPIRSSVEIRSAGDLSDEIEIRSRYACRSWWRSGVNRNCVCNAVCSDGSTAPSEHRNSCFGLRPPGLRANPPSLPPRRCCGSQAVCPALLSALLIVRPRSAAGTTHFETGGSLVYGNCQPRQRSGFQKICQIDQIEIRSNYGSHSFMTALGNTLFPQSNCQM